MRLRSVEDVVKSQKISLLALGVVLHLDYLTTASDFNSPPLPLGDSQLQLDTPLYVFVCLQSGGAAAQPTSHDSQHDGDGGQRRLVRRHRAGACSVCVQLVHASIA